MFKNTSRFISLIIIPIFVVLFIGTTATAVSLLDHVEGKILLQVQQHGEAWYVHNGKRYYMKDGDVAYRMMRFFSLGITDQDLEQIPLGDSIPKLPEGPVNTCTASEPIIRYVSSEVECPSVEEYQTKISKLESQVDSLWDRLNSCENTVQAETEPIITPPTVEPCSIKLMIGSKEVNWLYTFVSGTEYKVNVSPIDDFLEVEFRSEIDGTLVPNDGAWEKSEGTDVVIYTRTIDLSEPGSHLLKYSCQKEGQGTQTTATLNINVVPKEE